MLLLVFCGGTLGTSLRYAAELAGPSANVEPWVAVLAVNLVATFFAAWIGRKYLALSRAHLSDVVDPFQKRNPKFNLFFVTGCMGGLSTFSSLSQELCQQMARGDAKGFALNLGLSLLLGVAAASLGLRLGQRTA